MSIRERERECVREKVCVCVREREREYLLGVDAVLPAIQTLVFEKFHQLRYVHHRERESVECVGERDSVCECVCVCVRESTCLALTPYCPPYKLSCLRSFINSDMSIFGKPSRLFNDPASRRLPGTAPSFSGGLARDCTARKARYWRWGRTCLALTPYCPP